MKILDIKSGDKSEEALISQNSMLSFGNQKVLENNNY